MPRPAAAYPWNTLERLSRRVVRETRHARRWVARSVKLDHVSGALAELLGVDAWVVLRNVAADVGPQSVDVCCALPGGGSIGFSPEPELVESVVSRVIGRSQPLSQPGAPLDASLRGALAAILIETARRSGGLEPLRVSSYSAAGSPSVRLDASVVIAGKAHAARVWVTAPATLAPEVEPDLARLGDLALTVPLVVALSLASPAELESLAAGDAWVPSAADWADAQLLGNAALAAAGAERGVAVVLAQGGSIVVGDHSVSLSTDATEAMSSNENDLKSALAESVLEAPVLVRVEVGSVSLSAREWAALEPGDVIETGRRINEPVVLRVAGREVARGELVEIEGELGVRIREIVSGERA